MAILTAMTAQVLPQIQTGLESLVEDQVRKSEVIGKRRTRRTRSIIPTPVVVVPPQAQKMKTRNIDLL